MPLNFTQNKTTATNRIVSDTRKQNVKPGYRWSNGIILDFVCGDQGSIPDDSKALK